MAWSVTYVATVSQTDQYGNANGDSFQFTGTQFIGKTTLGSSDFTNIASNVQTDFAAKLASQFPVDFTVLDSGA